MSTARHNSVLPDAGQGIELNTGEPFAAGISSRGIEILRVLNLMFNDMQQRGRYSLDSAVPQEE